jgi:hypothetical protein
MFKDDIDMAETIIMHQSNKRARSTLWPLDFL